MAKWKIQSPTIGNYQVKVEGLKAKKFKIKKGIDSPVMGDYQVKIQGLKAEKFKIKKGIDSPIIGKEIIPIELKAVKKKSTVFK